METYVCWSVKQQMGNALRDALIHVQGEYTSKITLCGIKTNRAEWDFEIHEDARSVSCVRCKRILHRAKNKQEQKA